MGTPVMGFLNDEFKWPRQRSAFAFGIMILILGLPTVFFFQKGVFDEYDYWAGTVSLVVFAMLEAILFAWFFGLEKGWAEINRGADIKIPIIFKYLLKYVTPVVLIVIFLGSLVTPKDDDWSKVSLTGWEVSSGSIIGQITHKGIGPNKAYFADTFYAEVDGSVDTVFTLRNKTIVKVTPTGKSEDYTKTYEFASSHQVLVKTGDTVKTGDPVHSGKIINNIFYIDMSRILLLLVFGGISFMVFIAYRKRTRENRI
jgi:hypothetical protein